MVSSLRFLSVGITSPGAFIITPFKPLLQWHWISKKDLRSKIGIHSVFSLGSRIYGIGGVKGFEDVVGKNRKETFFRASWIVLLIESTINSTLGAEYPPHRPPLPYRVFSSSLRADWLRLRSAPSRRKVWVHGAHGTPFLSVRFPSVCPSVCLSVSRNSDDDDDDELDSTEIAALEAKSNLRFMLEESCYLLVKSRCKSIPVTRSDNI